MDRSSITIQATPFKVRQLVELKREGKLHLPDLQRGFVWDDSRVRMLFDSLFRLYPVGSLLLWRPVWESAEAPINVRPWDLFPPNRTTEIGEAEPAVPPQPGAVFVLDGQQRLTALFRVIFSSRRRGSSVREPNLYVSLSRDEEWAAEPFLYKSRQVKKEDERRALLVPAEVLFAGVRSGAGNGAESLAVSKAISEWVKPDVAEFYSAMDRANEIRNAILNAEVVSYEIDTQAEDESVIEIFGRLNQQAVRLTPADLAAARLTGKMKDFRGRAATSLAASELRDFSVSEGTERAVSGGFVDTDLIVRTAMCLATGIVKYRDAEKKGDKSALYSKIEPCWPGAVDGLKKIVAILRNAGVPDGSWLPYRYILLTPAVAVAKGQRRPDDEWMGWAIAASLWGLYGGSAETKVQTDARHASQGDWSALWQSLKTYAKRRETLIPDAEDLTHGLVQTSGVLLALLVAWTRGDARSFFQSRFAARSAALHVHHIFPRSLFSGLGRAPKDSSRIPDRIGNLTVITETDNTSLGDDAPSEYFPRIEASIRRTHCIPEDSSLWTLDRYAEFCTAREVALAGQIASLMKEFGVP
ncbi:GmrSD restriction endonuclease domain-containing protein [Polyangium fumosum]|uniref:DUF262 domain-containing protein n=1 Tax=Polyangium fumosum TaxID=889272 RepID=A0A4U1JE10_9BACT|nr:DUF262 domain-containing protein [Polyangium fumosum]TKD09219.1 DUF262 domain-containing protein [Polyangium fumosum]